VSQQVSEQVADPPVRVVLVVREGLAPALAVNAGVVLGVTIGTALGLPLGAAGADASGTAYPGIVTTPVPVLVADAGTLRALFAELVADEQLRVACLTDTARRARSYEDYLVDLAATPDADADITALVVAGPRNRVTKRTKRLGLLA
jgi:hypothetical protein